MIHTPSFDFSSSSSLQHKSPQEPFSLSRHNNVFDKQPADLVDKALQTLQQAGVELIEWRALLYRRMNVPIIVKDYSYVVPDEDLDAASAILVDIGLPVTSTSRLLARVEGDIHTKGRFHRLTRSTAQAWAQHMVLYPISFASISASELTEQLPAHVSPPILCTTILVPRPSAVYAFILRTMLNYPKFCSTRTVLASDLSELVGYHLLGIQQGYVDPEDEERWEELGLEHRIASAIQLIKQWNWNGEWRDGEEWMGDALAAVVSGSGDIEYLPCRT